MIAAKLARDSFLLCDLAKFLFLFILLSVKILLDAIEQERPYLLKLVLNLCSTLLCAADGWEDFTWEDALGLKSPKIVRLSIAEDVALIDEVIKFIGCVTPAESFAEYWIILAGKAHNLLDDNREVLHEKLVERLAELWQPCWIAYLVLVGGAHGRWEEANQGLSKVGLRLTTSLKSLAEEFEAQNALHEG